MKKRWLGILLALCLLVCFAPAALAAETDSPVDPIKVYVDGEQGDDTNGNGSQERPYATLATAVKEAAKEHSATIYVMSDLTMSECARFWTGNITITSAPGAEDAYIISRGEDMESADDSVGSVQDMARGGYNPALIEVGNAASLTLENIILDDGHIMAYTYSGNDPYARAEAPVFVQVDASRGGNVNDGNQDNDPGSTTVGETNVSNFEIVQDAIIATYSNQATITLGDGAVLQNYGGMSAVRVSGGTLVMKSGSKICDSDTSYTRIKGATDSYGPAGAVWVQSGTVEMQEGSSIENLDGRAIYEDGAGSNVTVDGTISGITGNANMWFGNDGRVWHLRGNAVGILTGTIENIKKSTNAVYVIYNSNFTMQEGSSLKNINGVGIQMYGISGGTLYMNGEITGLTDSAIHMNMNAADKNKPPEDVIPLKVIIGPQGNIHHNYGSPYGTVTSQAYKATIDVYGKINYNFSSDRAGITMATNMNDTTVTLHDNAEVCYNVGKGISGAMVAQGTFIMEPGSVVSHNIAYDTNESYSGIFVRRDGIFIMNGGTISNNSSAKTASGISYMAEEYNLKEIHPHVQLNAGIITENKKACTITGTTSAADSYSSEGGNSNDLTVLSTGTSNISRYLTISDDVTLSEESIYMQKGNYYIERPAEGVKLGNASTDGETALKEASSAKGWSDTLLASFWAQADNNQTWVLSGLEKETDKTQLPVYALVMPTNAEGNVGTNTKATVYAVTVNADGTWSFTVPGGNEKGYVVGLVQPTKDYGTLTLVANPATLTEDVGGTVNYTATYTPAKNLINQLDGSDTFTLTITLARGMTYVADSGSGLTYDAPTHTLTMQVSANKLQSNITVSFSATAPDKIKAGDTFVTNAVLEGTITVGGNEVPVTLVANATVEVTPKPEDPIEPTDPPYIPPIDPDEPADPDDTGVSDLLNTEDHIQYLFGYPDGTFGPENNMTRAEVAQMFYNLLLDQDVEITKTFDDVPANAWYTKAVNTLASLDIISGVGDNKFEPERSITRAEFTAMAMKFAVGGEEGENIFSDVDENDWFYDAVVNSIQYGWIHGYGDGTFRPNNPITRAEVTAIVNNMLGRAADEDFVDEHAEELTPFSDIEKHWAYYHIVEATNDHDYTKPSSGENWTKLN